MSDSLFEKARKFKGYGSYPKSKSRSCVAGLKSFKGGKVNVTVIKSLDEYVRFVGELETSFENPVFYRGQTNANYLLIPYALRNDPKYENRMIEAFIRYFAHELDACRNAVAKLALMQHYGLKTRFLDISENPLAALYFACVPCKKFRSRPSTNEDNWGEIVLFQEPKKNDDEEDDNARPKTAESSNASIIANTAFMNPKFSLWQLGSYWKKDANQSYDEKHIDLTSIVRKSLIVRVPQDNPRIKNQHGAFILANANTAYLEKNYKAIKEKELTEYILEKQKEGNLLTYAIMLEDSPFKHDLGNIETWHMKFWKVKPYDEKTNEFEEFRTDPFDLRRIFYKDKNGIQQVVLIPPEAKETIKKELARFNIREDFIYPDMDSVANEINETIDRKD
ncbi:MAG: FRG domain-containing protein [Treponemataceae bacterium]|nr:FRG domain-containing protein [Treponemataceae bacterium]